MAMFHSVFFLRRKSAVRLIETSVNEWTASAIRVRTASYGTTVMSTATELASGNCPLGKAIAAV